MYRVVAFCFVLLWLHWQANTQENDLQATRRPRRLLNMYTALPSDEPGDQSLEQKDTDGALLQYGRAERLVPDNLKMKFWHAVSLSNASRLKQALPLFSTIFRRDDHWRTLVPRLAAAGLLTVDAVALERIVQTAPVTME